MKKVVLIFIAVVISVVFVGCSKNNPPVQKQEVHKIDSQAIRTRANEAYKELK